jgi:hypothetical protein
MTGDTVTHLSEHCNLAVVQGDSVAGVTSGTDINRASTQDTSLSVFQPLNREALNDGSSEPNFHTTENNTATVIS